MKIHCMIFGNIFHLQREDISNGFKGEGMYYFCFYDFYSVSICKVFEAIPTQISMSKTSLQRSLVTTLALPPTPTM